MQERVEALNEKLDLVLSGGEKLTDGELSAEGGPTRLGYAKKQCKCQYIIILNFRLRQHRRLAKIAEEKIS